MPRSPGARTSSSVPVISVVGRSNSGKTTVLEGLIAELTRRGLRVGVLKHAGHGFEMDREGTDTWRHRRAGAAAVGIMSDDGVAVIRALEGELPLAEAAALLGRDLDVVLTEGFRQAPTRKLEVIRADLGGDVQTPPQQLLAVVADGAVETGAPVIAFEDASGLADVVVAEIKRPL